MAIIKLYPNGSTSGRGFVKPDDDDYEPPIRGETIGWTYGVSRRMKQWMYSIHIDSLSGYGLSFTLTVRNCPTDSKQWADVRRKFIQRLVRDGCIRLQWLTEWQRRGVPHLHGIAYFDKPYHFSLLIQHWLDLTQEPFGAAIHGQDCKIVHSVQGWLDYLCKHAIRGITHYQRSMEHMPETWTKAGRMWGKRGDWPQREALEFKLDSRGFYAYRRMARNYHYAKMRSLFYGVVFPPKGLYRRMPRRLWMSYRQQYYSKFLSLRYANRALKSSDVESRFYGTSHWMPLDVSVAMMVFLGSQGYAVSQLDGSEEEG